MNVIRVPKLKIDASWDRLPDETIIIKDMEIPVIITVNDGMPFFEILENIIGRDLCRDIEKRALEPPIIEDKITEVVANNADMATNSNMNKLLVATVKAASTGSVDIPKICQFNNPTAIKATAI